MSIVGYEDKSNYFRTCRMDGLPQNGAIWTPDYTDVITLRHVTMASNGIRDKCPTLPHICFTL